MATKADRVLAGRLANLEKANEVRTRKARFKEDLSRLEHVEACRLVADRLLNDHTDLGSFSVQELLLSIDGIGKTKAGQLARSADWTNLTDRVARLTVSRRQLLARALEHRADEREGRVRSAA